MVNISIDNNMKILKVKLRLNSLIGVKFVIQGATPPRLLKVNKISIFTFVFRKTSNIGANYPCALPSSSQILCMCPMTAFETCLCTAWLRPPVRSVKCCNCIVRTLFGECSLIYIFIVSYKLHQHKLYLVLYLSSVGPTACHFKRTELSSSPKPNKVSKFSFPMGILATYFLFGM